MAAFADGANVESGNRAGRARDVPAIVRGRALMPTRTRSRTKLPGSEPEENFDKQTDENEDQQAESIAWRTRKPAFSAGEQSWENLYGQTIENEEKRALSMPY